ncbi:hypothetical protein L1887_18552 [Cichorium endivia]|nr:hypothetical protein L1887_18552 [Cichorium endivia]
MASMNCVLVKPGNWKLSSISQGFLTQIGGDALMIAMILGDIGKLTDRLDKEKVRDGSCYWEKPHYETLKLI